MKKEYNNEHKEAEQSQLNEPAIVYQTQEESAQSFEKAWAEALTPEEFWGDIHQMIDDWYAKEKLPQTFEEVWAEALTPEEFMEEMEKRIRKW